MSHKNEQFTVAQKKYFVYCASFFAVYFFTFFILSKLSAVSVLLKLTKLCKLILCSPVWFRIWTWCRWGPLCMWPKKKSNSLKCGQIFLFPFGSMVCFCCCPQTEAIHPDCALVVQHMKAQEECNQIIKQEKRNVSAATGESLYCFQSGCGNEIH